MSKSPKFCPFGFYSFFVSKEAAQAGGCHHCLEEKCGLWESFYDDEGNVTGQCSILGVGESLRSISESMAEVADGKIPSFNAEPIMASFSEAVKPVRKLDSFLDKIRNKKAAEVQKQMETASAAPITTEVSPPIAVEPPVVTSSKLPDDLEALLNPPPLPADQLPIISKNPSSVGGISGEVA